VHLLIFLDEVRPVIGVFDIAPDETMFFPSGPRISRVAFSSLLCIAMTSALLASSADGNVFWPGGCAMERVDVHPAKTMAITATLENPSQQDSSDFNFVRIPIFSVSFRTLRNTMKARLTTSASARSASARSASAVRAAEAGTSA
jgi:hypothetical protein